VHNTASEVELRSKVDVEPQATPTSFMDGAGDTARTSIEIKVDPPQIRGGRLEGGF